MGFGHNMRVARESRGMTQAELAEAVGCAQPTIAQYEHEAKAPTVILASKIAKILGTTCDELVNGRSCSNEN